MTTSQLYLDWLQHGHFSGPTEDSELDALWSRYYQAEYWLHRGQLYFTFDPSVDAATARSWLDQFYPHVLTEEFEEGSPYRQTMKRAVRAPRYVEPSMEPTRGQRYYAMKRQDAEFLARKRARDSAARERVRQDPVLYEQYREMFRQRRQRPDEKARLKAYEQQRYARKKMQRAAKMAAMTEEERAAYRAKEAARVRAYAKKKR